MSCLLVCYAGNLVAIKECLRFIDFILVHNSTHTHTFTQHTCSSTHTFIDQALCIKFMPESMQQSRSVCGVEVNVMISICQQHPQLPHSPFPSPHIPQNSGTHKKCKMWVTFSVSPRRQMSAGDRA